MDVPLYKPAHIDHQLSGRRECGPKTGKHVFENGYDKNEDDGDNYDGNRHNH